MCANFLCACNPISSARAKCERFESTFGASLSHPAAHFSRRAAAREKLGGAGERQCLRFLWIPFVRRDPLWKRKSPGFHAYSRCIPLSFRCSVVHICQWRLYFVNCEVIFFACCEQNRSFFRSFFTLETYYKNKLYFILHTYMKNSYKLLPYLLLKMYFLGILRM